MWRIKMGEKIFKILCLSAFLLISSPANAKKAKMSWQIVNVSSNLSIEQSSIKSLLKKEMKTQYSKLLNFKYLIRIEIKGGFGKKRVGETVFFLKQVPDYAVVKGKSDLPYTSSIMVSQFKTCKWNKKYGRHHCPNAGISKQGSVNITKLVQKKHILVISRSRRKGKSKTIFWFAYNENIKPIYYLAYGIDRGLGKDVLSGKIYILKPDALPTLPPLPDDIKTKLPVVKVKTPVVKVKPPVVKTPVVKVKTPVIKPPGISRKFKQINTFQETKNLKSMLKKDYLGKVYSPNDNLHWVRVQVKGLDSKDGVDFTLSTKQTVQKFYIFAWTDKVNKFLTSIGDADKCSGKSLKGCPYKLNGKWYNMTGLIKSDKINIRSFPNKSRMGQFIIWMAFKNPSKTISYKSPGLKSTVLASTWKPGTKSSVVVNKFKTKFKPKVYSITIKRLTKYIKKDNLVANESGLLGYNYVMRVAIIPNDKSHQFSLLIPGRPNLVLGKSFTTLKNRKVSSKVQLGKELKCKSSWCPLHFNGLGWRDLTSGFGYRNSKMIIKQKQKGEVKKIIYWMGFNRKPTRKFITIKNSGKFGSPVIKSTIFVVTEPNFPVYE
jgi:hypothetical protein